jgi:predicted dinucleotide-binding enzyme
MDPLGSFFRALLALAILCSAQWDVRGSIAQERKKYDDALVSTMINGADGKLKVGIIGTGKMGTHLAATWAKAGIDVLLGSRVRSRSQEIVDSLLAGKGYGDIRPFDPAGMETTLTAGTIIDAASRPVVVLATPFYATSYTLKKYKAKLWGRGVHLIDITNPWLSGAGLPADGPQSAVKVHQAALNDPSARFAVGYKRTMWNQIFPGAVGPGGGRVKVDIAGDDEAKRSLTQLVSSM